MPFTHTIFLQANQLSNSPIKGLLTYLPYYMIRNLGLSFYSLIGLIFFLCQPNFLYSQCVIDSLVPNTSGIYPEIPPPAPGCEFYETDITFVLPRDTMVNIVGQMVRIPFQTFKIEGVAGLPLGMDWVCNLDTSCLYDVSPGNPNPDSVGCIRIFGTPIVPNTYPIVVYITATVDFLGTPRQEQSTFETELTVEPCIFAGSCYSYTVSSNCQPGILELTNNLPSSGKSGYEYQWQVTGPGGFNYATQDENPFPQTLTEAGEYIISYDATIDTIGYFLDSVIITQVGCSDIADPADLYWILKNPAGVEIVNTSGNVLSNSGNNLPLNTGIGGILLDTGLYELQVWDKDNVIADAGCATNSQGSGASVFFSIPPVNTGIVSVSMNSLSVDLGISNPVHSFSCTDSFQVESLPVVPLIEADTNRICEGVRLALTTQSQDSLQWYLDGLPLLNATDTFYNAYLEGTYTLEAINRNTLCAVSSTGFDLEIFSVDVPSIAYDGNMTLSVGSPSGALRYDWYRKGFGLAGSGSPFTVAKSGIYYARAVDTTTGCFSPNSAELSIILSGVNPLEEQIRSWHIYPNPNIGSFMIELSLREPLEIDILITDMLGREVFRKNGQQPFWQLKEEIRLHKPSPGMYWVHLQNAGLRTRKAIVVQ